METLTKCCTKCKKVKPLGEFGKFKMQKDGLKIYCKVCNNLFAKIWRSKNKDYYKSDNYKECHKKYRQTEKYKKYQNQYCQLEKYKKQKKEYRHSDIRTKADIKKQLKRDQNITNPPTELIECKLLIIKTKRLCKTLNN
jgi:hypothetical protein